MSGGQQNVNARIDIAGKMEALEPLRSITVERGTAVIGSAQVEFPIAPGD